MVIEFNENGQIIVPALIKQDLEEEKIAKSHKMSIKQYKKIQIKISGSKADNDRLQKLLVEMTARETTNNNSKKFEDAELIVQHSNGFSDLEIAKIFRCCKKAIWERRCKLKLVANFEPWFGERLDEGELNDRRLEKNMKSRERYYFKKTNK
jgi:hypothetical protein